MTKGAKKGKRRRDKKRGNEEKGKGGERGNEEKKKGYK